MSHKRLAGAIPEHKISDGSRLLWERYYGPMQGAAAQMNAAIQNTQNILGQVILEKEGFSPDTHIFNADRMVILPRPKKGDNGALG